MEVHHVDNLDLFLDQTFNFPHNKTINPPPEDVDLIEQLWKQDVDLGVDRAFYDASLRQELEKERELELLKQKEKKKAQLAAQAREEKAKQEQTQRWLKKNFKRDGETGEWVKLQNSSNDRNNATHLTSENLSDDSLTLEAALDFLSSGLDPDLLNFENPEGQAVSSFESFSSSYDLSPLAEYPNVQVQQETQVPSLQTQDSFDESFNGFVNFLNLTSNAQELNDVAAGGLMPELPEYKPDYNSHGDFGMLPQVDQSAILFQNATMPTPEPEMACDYGMQAPSLDLNVTAVAQSSPVNSSIDLGLDSLDMFNDLPTLPDVACDELDINEVDFLLDMDNASDIMDEVMGPSYNSTRVMSDSLSDSSVALGGSPSLVSNEDFAGLEGAMGGSNFSAGDYEAPYSKISRLSESSMDSGIGCHGFSSSPSSSSSSSYAGSPTGSQHGNSSTGSNHTEHDPYKKGSLAHQIAHNHTYNTLPGQIPREVKKYAQKEPSKKGPHSRDQKRASELKVPFTVEEIIESPVDTFNEMITKHKLSKSQLSLIRDIRRRGKNKVAAQNCRKRKVHVIVSLSDELTDIEEARDRLKAEREEIEKETRMMKDRFNYLYNHIFQSLRDERGEPYDPNMYSLQQTSDGNVFLVPRNMTNNHTSEVEEKESRKRKQSG